MMTRTGSMPDLDLVHAADRPRSLSKIRNAQPTFNEPIPTMHDRT